MRYTRFGSTDWETSVVGLGAWALGADWGRVSDADAAAALDEAAARGVNLIDTADVYGDGLSERRIAAFRRSRPDVDLIVLTKAGRRLSPHNADGYNQENLTAFVDRSRQNLEVETLDLVQLHCPPTEVYYRPEVFEALDSMVDQGRIRHYGVSVEKVEEGLKALEYPGVTSIQIIFNMLRQRPADLFLAQAASRGVAVVVRVPLASGLLSGKFDASSRFEPDDHRNFNRFGEAFDVGETFAGLPFEAGLAAVEELRGVVPEGWSMAQMALRWILDFDAVTTVIPGARNASQVAANASAADLRPLDDGTVDAVASIYARHARPHVHHRW